MNRPRLTPYTWYNENKTLMFRTDEYGMTDICPGPRAGLFKWIEANYGEKLYSPRRAFNKDKDHIHWAYPSIDDPSV